MPAPVAAAIATTIGVETATVIFAAKVAALVALTAHSQRQARKKARSARDAFNASLTDHQVMIRSGVAPRTITYGRDKVSGPIVFAHSTGAMKEFLHLVIPLSGREIDAVEAIYFNETELPALDVNGFVTSGPFSKTVQAAGFASSSTTTIALAATPSSIQTVTYTHPGDGGQALSLTGYTVSGTTVTVTESLPAGMPSGGTYNVNYTVDQSHARVRIKIHLGGAGQVADADLIAECGDKWTSAHVGVGVPYLYVRLQYDQDIFGQVGLPNISARIRGAKVLDTRTSTTAWSENAALCTRDYMRHALLGLGCSDAEVPQAEANAAANIADEDVATSGSTSQKRYTTNGTLSTGDGRRANLEALLAPMDGNAVHVQGRWLLRAGAARAFEFTFDESWLAQGAIQIMPRRPRTELFNAVTGTFVNPAELYAEVQIPIVTNAGYEAEDGGKRITRRIDMPLVRDSVRAQRLGKIELERARQALTVRVVCNMRAYDTLPTQVGRVSLARYGFSNKLFEVVERRANLTARTITLTLQETAATLWDWAFGEATVRDPAPNTTLPSVAAPAQLASFAAVAGSAQIHVTPDGTSVQRALLTWTQSTDAFVVSGGRIEAEWKPAHESVWQAAPAVPGSATSTLVGPIDGRWVTNLRVRAVNATGRPGPWANATLSPIGTSQPLRLLSHGTSPMEITVSSARKPAGVASAWDSGVYSAAGHAGGAFVAFRATDPTTAITCGLTRTPTTDADFDTIDRAICLRNDGVVQIFEAGVSKGTFGSYAAGDEFSVTYDGTIVRYWRNGVELASTPWVTTSALHLDSSFFTPTGKLGDIRFGPFVKVAAHKVLTTTASSVTIDEVQHTPEGQGFNTQICSITFTPEVACEIGVKVSGQLNYTTGTAGTIDFQHSVQQDSAYDAFAERHEFDPIGASKSRQNDISYMKRFAVAAGVSTTIKYMGAKFASDDSVNVANVEMVIEVMER